MKKLFIVTAIALASMGAMAQSANSDSSSYAATSSASQSAAIAAGGSSRSSATGGVATTGASTASSQAASNAQNITFTAPADTTQTINYGTDQVIKNTPSVSGPALTTSNDTCMGSTSGSVNIAGLGIGGGSTWTDTNCKMLKNSRELWNMGMKAASLALMCTDSANKEALEMTGYVCPTKAPAEKTSQVVPVKATTEAERTAQYTGTDPFVRARLGLAPLETAAK